jgi:hypothetical protein
MFSSSTATHSPATNSEDTSDVGKSSLFTVDRHGLSPRTSYTVSSDNDMISNLSFALFFFFFFFLLFQFFFD